MPQDLTVAALQHIPIPNDLNGTLKQLSERATEASGEGAQILVVPEASITGYNITPTTMRAIAQSDDGELANSIAELCVRHRIAIAYGYAEKANNNFYNCVQVIDATGSTCGKYRKTHLWGDLDRSLFTAGSDIAPLFSLHGWSVGLLICYDIEFPECARRLAMEGADLLLVPTGLMRPWREVAEMVVPVRAYENQLYIAYTNYCGNEADLTYEGRTGQSGLDNTIATNSHTAKISNRNKQNSLALSSRPEARTILRLAVISSTPLTHQRAP